MIEICCGSYEDALAASRGGAERIELNCALALGGLTPSVGCLRLVKKNTALKVISMVRPRGAGFCYTETEAEQMFEDPGRFWKTEAMVWPSGFSQRTGR